MTQIEIAFHTSPQAPAFSKPDFGRFQWRFEHPLAVDDLHQCESQLAEGSQIKGGADDLDESQAAVKISG